MLMRIVVLVSLVYCDLLVGAAHSAGEKGAPAKDKPNPDRLSGMKTAVADIAAGKLKQKFPPFPDSVQQTKYTELLKKECAVDSQVVEGAVGPGKARDEMNGYNDVMRVEIEYRFGAGTLDKLWKKAGAQNK
jgi:hypothetical protein